MSTIERVALVALFIVIGVWILITVSVSVLNRNYSRFGPSNPCVLQLRQFDGAKQQWMLEAGKTTNDTPSWLDIRQYYNRGTNIEMPTCPAGGIYTIGPVGERPLCSLGGPAHSVGETPNQSRQATPDEHSHFNHEP